MVPHTIEVARKPKSLSGPSTNGEVNGAPVHNGLVGKRKRDADEAELDDQEQIKKRGKIQVPANNDDLVVLDDSSNGAILID